MSLASDVEKFVKLSEEKSYKVIRASLLRLGNPIIQMTPVDKGRLKNNWRSAVGSINIAEQKNNSTSGTDAMSELNESIKVLRIGQSMYFSNTLHYAPKIEYDGYSLQAPNGMLRVNLNKWNKIVAEEVDRYK